MLHFRLSARLGLSFVFFYSFCFCNSTRKGGAVRNKSSDFRSILQQAETTLSSLLLSLFCVCVLALMEKSHLYFSILSFALTRSPPPPRPRGRTRGLVPLFLFARCINGLRMAKYTVNGSNLPLPLFLLYTHHHPYMREKRLRRKSLICYCLCVLSAYISRHHKRIDSSGPLRRREPVSVCGWSSVDEPPVELTSDLICFLPAERRRRQKNL